MRPIHALILVVVLALAVTGVALLVGNDGAGHEAGAPSAGPASSGAAAPRAPASLATPEDAATKALVPADAATKTPLAAAPTASRSGGSELTGRVIDARGKPVAGARVLADSGGQDDVPIDVAGEEETSWLGRAEAKTDADGRFAIAPRAKSQLRLGVRAPGFAPFDEVRTIAAEKKELGDLVIEDGVVLTGRVIDSSGRGVAGAKLLRVADASGGLVFLGGAISGVTVAETDAQGRFRVDELRAGAWKLRIESEDHPDKTESGVTDRPGAVVANLEFALEDGFEIEGRVVGAPSELVPKLFVRAFARPGGDSTSLSDIVPAGELFGAARKAKCASDGSFRVKGLKKGLTYRLVARDSDHEFMGRSRSAPVQASAGERGVQLPYRAETAILCQVVDASGAPLEELDVTGGFGFALPLMDESGRPQHHFAEGRVRFASFPGRARPDQRASLRIEATGYKPFERTDLAPVEGQDLDLGVVRLERSPVVLVEVRDARTKAPISGVRVGIAEYEPDDATPGMRRFERRVSISTAVGGSGEDGAPDTASSARTDKQGKAKLTSLPGKTVTLRATHSEYAPWVSEPIVLPADGDHVQTIELGPGGTVLVTVVDQKEHPVAGVEVEHKGPGEELEFLVLGAGREDKTDAQGRIAFEHLMPGAHRFRVGDGGGGAMFVNGGMMKVASRSRGMPEPEGFVEATVVAGETTPLLLVAPERSSIAGRVTESGRPLAGARVELEPADGDDEMRLFGGGGSADQTDAKGEYQVENVKVGAYRAVVTHSSRAMPWSVDVEVKSGENRLDVELPVAIVEGRVSGPDGKPLAGVRMRAEKAPDDSGSGRPTQRRVVAVMTADGMDEPEIAFGPGSTGPTVLTDAEGKYKLRGVLPDVDLVVKAQAKDVQPAQSEKVRVAADQTKSGVDLQLQTGGTIEITLVRRDGQPASSCMVVARFEGEGDVEPKTEFSGSRSTVKLTGLKPGRWKVRVDALGIAGGDDRPPIPEQTVEVLAGKNAPARFEIP